MRIIMILKFFFIAVVISLYAKTSSEFGGNVIEVDANAVKIDIMQVNKVPIGSRVNLYYKTSFGQKMEVGQWRVTGTDETIIYAEPINIMSKPMVGLYAEVISSAYEDKIEVSKEDHHNVHLLPQNSNFKEGKKDSAIDSQLYVDKAKQTTEDMKKNAKNYSKQKIKKSFDEYLKNVRKAVLMDNAEAYYMLALIYEDGYGDFKSDIKKWLII
ncbi:hypothetical protein ACLHDG_05005 [Sulfurovum sp. CS9]|uniref:hypothetical protein n=1 Tax=Sulfurovum sp. CS9 TaxID=3391146 RepID=UPI0039EAF8BB